MHNTRRKRSNKKPVFTKKHYLSNDGMLTTVWGPSTWHLLHTMSFNYPVNPTCDDKRNYRNFILSLQDVLPCGKCRKNLRENFKKHPLNLSHMESRSTFSLYIYKLHEIINKMLGKKSGLTYGDVRERYEHFRSRCNKSIEELKQEHEDAKNKSEKVAIPEVGTSVGIDSFSGKTTEEFRMEKGCTEPLYGEKAKCILKIVPDNTPCDTFDIDEKCMKKKLIF